jgi:alpha-L-fucosidase
MIKRLFALILLFQQSISFAQSDTSSMELWRAQKYSMFIHFGIYSQLGGVWDGKQISRGLSEQIQAHAGIYSDTYARVAKSFNPTYWNADSIALLAKNAGMRSIVITSKHHDGFCMFKTATTNFNVVDATPYKRDVLKELSEACKRHGIRFGLYFSLIDWHYPEASPISSHNSDWVTPEHHEYNKKQLTELLTNYGTISELWFDMGSQSIKYSKELRELVHRLQPDCKVGSRIGNDMGDFTVMSDNQQPDYIIGVPWQSPASFFDETWGYRSWQKRDHPEEKFKEKLTSLIKVVSRGGNYLLNIGPRGNGTVVEFEKDILLKIGDWLQKNGEAIYGTHADPFQTPFAWGSITSRPNKLYLHLLHPVSGPITLPGIKGKIKQVYLLEDKSVRATAKSSSQGITINLPAPITEDDLFKVFVVEFENGYSVRPAHLVEEVNGKYVLNSSNAFKYYSSSGIDYNTNYQSTIKEAWYIEPAHSAKLTPHLYFTDEEKGKAIELTINGKTETIQLNNDDSLTLILRNDTASLKWSPIYQAGPYWSGIDGLHDKADDIDLAKPWGGQAWTKTEYKPGDLYNLPADMTTAYYLLQEVVSDKEQSIIVSITSGDGVLVVLNGQELLLHNNPAKEKSVSDEVLLPLKKGKNQLLIKLFNNFQQSISFSLNTNTPQTIYSKKLETISLQKGKLTSIEWKLHNPATPHETLKLPNVKLVME